MYLLHMLLILYNTTQFKEKCRNKSYKCKMGDEATSSGKIGYLRLFTRWL